MSNAHGGRKVPKSVLELPELGQAKSAVLNTLSSVDSQRTYGQAMDQFIRWYCSEPRLAFSRIIVLRYRIHLERSHYAPATINLHLAAVRRLAYEATDAGLLSAELAAGIRRVRHPPRSGWLDELGRLKGGWATELGVARCAPYWLVQNWAPAPSATSWSRMYWRTWSSSNPTVDTA